MKRKPAMWMINDLLQWASLAAVIFAVAFSYPDEEKIAKSLSKRLQQQMSDEADGWADDVISHGRKQAADIRARSEKILRELEND